MTTAIKTALLLISPALAIKALIWAYDLYERWRIDMDDLKHDYEGLVLTGEIEEGITKDGKITYRWRREW